jgi:hypothetical protein
MEHKDTDMHHALTSFAKCAIDLLRKKQEEGASIPKQIVEDVFEVKTGFSFQRKEEPDLARFAIQFTSEIEKQDVASNAIEVVAGNKMVRKYYENRFTDNKGKVIEPPDIRPFVKNEFVIRFLTTLLTDTDKIETAFSQSEVLYDAR